VALSFAAATFCFGETKKTEPAASPAPASTAKTTAPKKEAVKMANLTVVYTEVKTNIKVTVDGVDKDGKKVQGSWVGMADGKVYKTKGKLAWDSAAYKVVNTHTYEITTMKDGKVFARGKSTVSADGKTRTLETAGTGADGKKFKNKSVYDKS